MTGLTKKDQQRVLDHVEKQGVTVTQTKSGYLMRMPDGGTAMLHKTTSDRMAPMALRAKLRRHGISWPFDGAKPEIPKYISDGGMRESTLEAYRETLRELGDGALVEEITASELARAHWARTRPDSPYPKNGGTPLMTAFRALYRLDYQQTGYRNGKDGFVWELPVAAEPEKPTKAEPFAPPVMFAVPETESTPAVNPEPPAPIQEAPALTLVGEREFLDSVDSWTLDLAEVGEDTVGALARMMRAAGLQLEVRVWRAS